jgi:hypothetical protein
MDFGKGIALGISIAMTLVIGLLAFELRDIGRTFADFGDVRLPLVTRVTISHAWLFGTPAAGTATCAALFVRRPASLVPYIAVAVLLVVVAVLTWYGPRLPIFELAGNIKAD